MLGGPKRSFCYVGRQLPAQIPWQIQSDALGHSHKRSPELAAAANARTLYASGDGPWLGHLEWMADRAYAA
jgi:hypothetical protein